MKKIKKKKTKRGKKKKSYKVTKDCNVEYPPLLGNGRCNGGKYNTFECGWDKGDCATFNENYPNCDVTYPYYIGDGTCDKDEYNNEDCGYDGGDCICFNLLYSNCTGRLDFLADGNCDEQNQSLECGWDAGDCEEI